MSIQHTLKISGSNVPVDVYEFMGTPSMLEAWKGVPESKIGTLEAWKGVPESKIVNS